MVTVEPCTRASLDLILSDEAHPIDLPPADDEGVRKACPLSEALEPEDSIGESSLIHSNLGSLPSSIPDHERQPITVHEFLQDMTGSKAGRKCGRRNRLGTVKLDAYDRSEQCRSSPAPTRPTSNRHIETQTQARIDRDRRVASAYPPRYPRRGRIHSEYLSRRKKRFAKSLAQRLFEADVFSSGTSSHSTGMTPDQNPAHTSSRRPLQFITSLNLTPSLESRIYGKNFGKDRTTSGSADSKVQPVLVSQVDGCGVTDSLQDDDSDDDCSTALASSGSKPSSRNWNGVVATWTTRKRTRARASPVAAMLGSGKRAFRTPRHGDGKRSSAQAPLNPFEYVPLPLVRVETASKTGATVLHANPNPVSYTGKQGRGMHTRTHEHASARVLKPISTDVSRQRPC